MNRGFTLLEIVIVLVIMGIFAGVGAASYNYNSQTKLLESDAENIIELVALARTYTTARVIKSQPCASFSGYTLSITPSSGTFELIQECSAQTTIQTNILDTTMVTSPGSPDSFTFQYPDGRIPSSENIVIKKENISRCIPILIDELGNTTIGSMYAC